MTDQLSRTDIDAALAEAKRQISDNWGWFLALGLLLIVAGVAAIGLLRLPPWQFGFRRLLPVGPASLCDSCISVKGLKGFLLSC